MNFRSKPAAKPSLLGQCLMLLCGVLLWGHQACATTYDWNGSVSSDWGTAANWTPNGVPATGDWVVLASASTLPELDQNRTIDRITIYSGALDLGGFTLSVTINGDYQGGSITNGTLHAASTGALSFAGTHFNAQLSGSAGTITFNGGVFDGQVSLTKTGASVDIGNGGCVFNNSASFSNSGAGNWWFGWITPDTFNMAVTYRSQSTSRIYTGNVSSGNYYGGTVYLQNTNSGGVYVGNQNGTTYFDNDIVVESSSTGTISIGRSNGTVTQKANQRIQVGGGGFSAGFLTLVGYTPGGTTTHTLTLSGTAVLTLGARCTFPMAVTYTAPGIQLSGGTYHGQTKLVKTGTPVDFGSGGNVFHDSLTLVNQGSGSLRTAIHSPDTFHSPVAIINTSSGSIYCNMRTTGNFHQAKTYVTNSGTGSLNMGWVNSSTRYAEDIIVESTSSGITRIGWNTATVTHDTDKELVIGSAGFSSGFLFLNSYHPSGTAARTLTLTGTAILALWGTSVYPMDITFTAPGLRIAGGTFNGEAKFVKTGTSSDIGWGGCVFHDSTTLVNQGTGQWWMAWSVPDTFYQAVTYVNTSSGRINAATFSTGNYYKENTYLQNTGTGTLYMGLNNGSIRFAGDVEVENTSTGAIHIGWNNAQVTQDAGKNILIGSNGFSSGTLSLNAFTPGGTSARSLTLGGSAILNLGAGSVYDMAVSFTAPNIRLNGGTFNNAATFVKTGSSGGVGIGGGTFNDSTTFVHNGGNHWWFSWNQPDTFNIPVTYINNSNNNIYCAAFSTGNYYQDKVYFKNNGTGAIYMGVVNGGTRFGHDIIVENAATGTINIGWSGATVTQDAGRNILIGSGGFSSGGLSLNAFTPGGTAPRSLTLTGNATLTLGAHSVYNMDVAFTAPGIRLSGGTYNGTATFVKTGGTFDYGTGGSVFNDSTSFVHNGSGSWRFAINNPDTFNVPVSYVNNAGGTFYCNMFATGNYYKDKAYFTNTNTGTIYSGYQTGSTRFGDDVALENTSTGSIIFGRINATTTMDVGKQLLIGSNGFNSGTLSISYFTPAGNAFRSLTLGGTARLTLGAGSLYNMDVAFTAPNITLNGGTYNGTAAITKTGTANDFGTGGCTFNGTTTIINNGTGQLRMGSTSADDFNGDVFYMRNSGTLFPAIGSTTTYARNVTVTSSTSVTFGQSGGTVTFDGSADQALNSTTATTIHNLTLSNSSSTGLTLNTPVTVTGALTLTDGHIYSSTANLLTLSSTATATSGSAASFVDGPMKKVGGSDFVFPIGDGTDWARLGILGTGAASTDEFTAEYFRATYPDLSVIGALDHVSTVEYWTLSRDRGTSSKQVQLFWEDNKVSGIANPATSDLRVAHYNGADWEDYGQAVVLNGSSGYVLSNLASVFSPFTFASLNNQNPLPVELLSFTAYPESGQVSLQWETASEINNDYFTIERSADGVNHYIPIAQVPGNGTTNQINHYQALDKVPLSGESFYRLKQTDFDGSFEYSQPVRVVFSDRGYTTDLATSVFPNPTSDQLQVTVIAPSDGPVALSIYNTYGQQVFQTTIDATANGLHQVSIPVVTLPAGAYLLKTQSESIQGQTVRFVKR